MTTKKRPILFSGPMVRAIKEGRKTQTRRIIKPQPWDVMPEKAGEPDWAYGFTFDNGSKVSGNPFRIPCPYGEPGDLLWVRETTWFRKDDGLTTYADGSFRTHPTAIIGSKVFPDKLSDWPSKAKSLGFKAVPSIHMPRWASRITLEIVSVRVERLQDISEADAIAEGCQCAGVPASLTNRGAFAKLWESINGPESWAANPWVWVVEFNRAENP